MRKKDVCWLFFPFVYQIAHKSMRDDTNKIAANTKLSICSNIKKILPRENVIGESEFYKDLFRNLGYTKEVVVLLWKGFLWFIFLSHTKYIFDNIIKQ